MTNLRSRVNLAGQWALCFGEIAPIAGILVRIRSKEVLHVIAGHNRWSTWLLDARVPRMGSDDGDSRFLDCRVAHSEGVSPVDRHTYTQGRDITVEIQWRDPETTVRWPDE
jgi:hypothetical protein